jgi:hypothetical protein
MQLPFFIANRYSFQYIERRPEFRNLKAIQVEFPIQEVIGH